MIGITNMKTKTEIKNTLMNRVIDDDRLNAIDIKKRRDLFYDAIAMLCFDNVVIDIDKHHHTIMSLCDAFDANELTLNDVHRDIDDYVLMNVETLQSYSRTFLINVRESIDEIIKQKNHDEFHNAIESLHVGRHDDITDDEYDVAITTLCTLCTLYDDACHR